MYTRRALCAALFAGERQSSQAIADQFDTTAEEVEFFFDELEQAGIARCVARDQGIWEPTTTSIDETIERATKAGVDVDSSLYRTTLIGGEAMGLPGFNKAIADLLVYLRGLVRVERARASKGGDPPLTEQELELRARLPNVWNARYVKFLGTSEDEQKAYAIRQAIDRLHKAHVEFRLRSTVPADRASATASLEKTIDIVQRSATPSWAVRG